MMETNFLKNIIDKEYLLDTFDKYVIFSATDLKGEIVYVSDAFSRISGYTKEELLGKNHNIIRHKDMPDKIFKELWATIKSGKTWCGEIKNRKKELQSIQDCWQNIVDLTDIKHNCCKKPVLCMILEKSVFLMLF